MVGIEERANRTERHSLLLWLLRAATLLLALARLVTSPDTFNPDGVSYLDVADEFLRLRLPVDALEYWSPLYPGLIALFRLLPLTEIVAVRVLNFALLVGAMIGFELFMAAVVKDRVVGAVSRSVFQAVGYAIFIWSALSLITVEIVTPDLTVFAIILYAASLMLPTIEGNRRAGAVLGLLLGLGYFAKAVMFPVGIFFCFAGLVFSRGAGRRATISALIVFLLSAAPLVLLLSANSGRFTTGSSARLNYAWYVEGVTRWIHWRGDPLHGEALSPAKLVFQNPSVYLFDEPFVRATYAPWFAPPHWYRGLQLRFDSGRQFRAIGRNLSALFDIVRPVALAILMIAIAASVGMRRPDRYRLALLTVAGLSIAIYLLVHLEGRFIAPALTLILVGLISNADSPADTRRGRAISLLVIVAVAIMIAAPINELIERKMLPGRRASREEALVDLLRKQGLESGERVAMIGDAIDASWARRSNLRIIAEVQAIDVPAFAQSPEASQREVLAAFAVSGATIVVAHADANPKSSGWIATSDRGFFIRKLPPPSTRHP